MGGPWDGATIVLPEGSHGIKVAHQKPWDFCDELDLCLYHTLPIVRTHLGRRIYWHEPK